MSNLIQLENHYEYRKKLALLDADIDSAMYKFYEPLTLKQFKEFNQLRNKLGNDWINKIDIKKISKKVKVIALFHEWKILAHRWDIVNGLVKQPILDNSAKFFLIKSA